MAAVDQIRCWQYAGIIVFRIGNVTTRQAILQDRHAGVVASIVACTPGRTSGIVHPVINHRGRVDASSGRTAYDTIVQIVAHHFTSSSTIDHDATVLAAVLEGNLTVIIAAVALVIGRIWGVVKVFTLAPSQRLFTIARTTSIAPELFPVSVRQELCRVEITFVNHITAAGTASGIQVQAEMPFMFLVLLRLLLVLLLLQYHVLPYIAQILMLLLLLLVFLSLLL